MFHRRESPPADVLSSLLKGERPLAWGYCASGAVVLATPRGLWWPEAGGPRLIGWQHIDKAIWRDGRLTVIEAEVLEDLLLLDRPAVSVELATPRDLPAAIRKRIEANVAHTEVRPVGEGAARFVARRVPGHDGVVWWARLEHGLADTEQVRSQLRAEIAVLRAEWLAAQA